MLRNELRKSRPKGPTRYSVIHWCYSPPSSGHFPGRTWITYSEEQHKAAMRQIKAKGGYVHDWQ